MYIPIEIKYCTYFKENIKICSNRLRKNVIPICNYSFLYTLFTLNQGIPYHKSSNYR